MNVQKPKCKGKGRFNINTKLFEITKECNEIKLHKNLTYIEFLELMKNNKINKIEFNNKKNQSILIEYI